MVLSAWRRVSGRFVGVCSILISSLDRFAGPHLRVSLQTGIRLS
jgi:hypothetical protein